MFDKTKKYFLPIWTFAKIGVRRAFRDKVALFFIFMFPLIFLFIFGGIFGKSGGVSFKVALINESTSQTATEFVKSANSNSAFKIDKKVVNLDEAQEKMRRGQLDASIVLPNDFGAIKNGKPSGQAKVYYTQNGETAGQTLTSVLNAQFQKINQQFVTIETPFTAASQQLSQKTLSRFDYTFAGLLGFSIIGLGIFGPVNVFPELKKQGVLRRLHTTPMTVSQYFLSNVLSQAVIGLISVALQFAVAIGVFHLKITGNILELIPFVILSIITILGIGLAIGGWARNEQQSAPLSNLVVFPMMFLSGTFFPRYAMPEWLQNVSNYIPLTPVIDGIRLIANEGKHLTDLGPQLAVMGVTIVVVYTIAFNVFRWE